MPGDSCQSWTHVAGDARRIAIIGSGGSGKSTLARDLSVKLDIPVVHLDAIFWRPGWVEQPQHEWRARQQELVRADSWIIDGNHGPTLDVRLSAADTVVLLDLSRFICMWRVVKRRLLYRRRPRVDRAPGCDEQLNWKFLRWVWTYPSVGLPEALEAISFFAPDAAVIRLTTRKAVERFVAEVDRSAVMNP